MKNFYEATVIKPNLTLGLCLGLKPTHGPVTCIIKFNNECVFGQNASDDTKIIANTKLYHSVPLTNPVDISIQLIDRQHPDALELSLTVDGQEIIPLYMNQAEPPTNYLDNNDVWQLHIPNFYLWYHQITGQGWIA
jgi:hypothetical protein